MSAEATVAVMEHAQGSDAEWRMLALFANAANPSGVVSGVSMTELAKRMGKTERGVSQVKRRLIDSGQLEVIEEGGGRGRTGVYFINLPGLSRPETLQNPDVTLNVGTGKSANTLKTDSRNGASGSTQGNNKGSSSSEKDAAALDEELRDCEVPDEMRADAVALLKGKRKVAGHVVTPGEMARAAAGLAAFNRCFVWKDREESDFGLGAALTSIVMRIRERPTWDPSKHVRLVESAWRIRWWEQGSKPRRPNPNVIYGERAFEQVAQDAKEEAEGKTSKVRYGRGAREQTG